MSESISFKALHEHYIESFNAHSWADVKACLSPGITIYVRGNLSLKDDWPQLEKDYRDHWAIPNARVITTELEEFDRGVVVKLRDYARNYLLDVRYTYGLEDGKWLQVKHEINAVTSAPEGT